MTRRSTDLLFRQLPPVPDDKPVLIAGPTASGKSALALEIAERHGGVIVNADASQVYDCWRVISARPSAQEEARAPHLLYGHVAYDQDYSTGHWLRDVAPLLAGTDRPIIVGGTGLYFMALTQGMADIPPTPEPVRRRADALSLDDLLRDLDARTADRLDLNNRARVQRAWEVLQATGRPLVDWQAETSPPLLPVKRTNTPTCIRAWQRRHAMKILTRSRTGSRRWPRPSFRTQTVSRKHWTHSTTKTGAPGLTARLFPDE